MADAVIAPGRGVRSRDLKGKTFDWTDLKVVHEFDNESSYNGYAVAYIDHPDDLARLGKTMGHCAGTHFVWACEERIWAFFTVITTADLRPHTTLHAKQLKWVGKAHPRDSAPYPYVRSQINNITCVKCLGYDGFRPDGTQYYYGERGINKCKACDGRGTVSPNYEKGENAPVPFPRSSSGAYPTYADVCKAFEKVGRKYESGKWAPATFNSQTYEISRDYKEPIRNFDGLYLQKTISQKPTGVEDDTWNMYQKAVKEMKGQFDKVSGAIQIVGRTFKFDAKEWYVLSFSGKGDFRLADSPYRGMMHEFFIENSKKKKGINGK